MKKFLLSLTALFFLAGCFDTTEEITIEKNGSGVYQVNADFKGFFELIEAMQAMDTSANSSFQKMPEHLDTTIHLSSFTDTASNLSKEEKALLHNATVNLVMNEKDKVFKMQMKYPYQSLNDVQKIIKLSQSGSNIIGKALQGSEGMQAEMQTPQVMPDFNSIYDITYSKGLIEKKVNAEKLKELQDDEQFDQMKQALMMVSEASVNTIIHLPKPAKKAVGTKLKLSSDKMTVTINSSLSDLFDDPSQMAYRVEY